MSAPYRSGLVALAGRPNVGKSTLANALAGTQVAAVSPRPQTTRRRITAVVHGEGWQAVLLDLPGFQRPADTLTTRMQATVDRSLTDCDAALFVLNAAEPIGGGDRFIAERLRASRLPVITVVNQIDRVDRDELVAVIARASELVEFASLHPVSARTGEGVQELRDDLPAILREGPRYFPEGMATDQTEEELAAELIREAALMRLRQEVPHALAVEIDEIEPARRGVVVRGALLVETESQKGIVVGRGGGDDPRHRHGRALGARAPLGHRGAPRPDGARAPALARRRGPAGPAGTLDSCAPWRWPSELGNVRAACRALGIHHSTFYRWRALARSPRPGAAAPLRAPQPGDAQPDKPDGRAAGVGPLAGAPQLQPQADRRRARRGPSGALLFWPTASVACCAATS